MVNSNSESLNPCFARIHSSLPVSGYHHVHKKVKMVLKKIDNRIRILIENGVQTKHRSLFVVVGDKGKDQVRFW